MSRKTISERFNTANSVSPNSVSKNIDQANGTQDDLANYFPTNNITSVNKTTGAKAFNPNALTQEIVLSQILSKDARIGKRQQVKLKEKNGSAASILTDYIPPYQG